MKRKVTLFKEFINQHSDLLQCPHCGSELVLDDNSLICNNNHRFDIHKKGYGSLIKTHKLKVDKVYTADLFNARRRFIEAGFYNKVYDVIRPYMKDDSIWLDMGSGEGTHGAMLIENCSAAMIGVDLAKDAIALATSYLPQDYIPLVGDLAHLPLQDHSCDGILNFLSPSNELEMGRVLKQDGLIIKVVPLQNYLKELRIALAMDEFEPTDYQFKQFEIVDSFDIETNRALTENETHDLFAMTPLSQHRSNTIILNSISIHLRVLVLRRKESL